MARCLYCGKKCVRKLKFCNKAHRKLYQNPPPKMIPCAGCGSPQRRPASTKGNVYCKRCKRPSGENHYKWKDGSFVDTAGYRMVLKDHRYYKEHRLEWERANKACLLEVGTIHHIRFDLPHNKVYNDPDNLVLVSDTEHGSFHRLFDAGRYQEAFDLLIKAGKRQLHYPLEITKFIESVNSN